MKTIKNIISKIFSKEQKQEGQQETRPAGSFKSGILQYRRQGLIRIAIIVAVVLGGALIAKMTMDNWKFKGYEVVAQKDGEDTATTQYIELDSNLLKYSGDNSSLVSSIGKELWTQTLDMESPAVDTCGNVAVIYAQKGTTMVMVGMEGKIGEVNTDMPILKARIASQGVVAAILEDGENTWINYYSTSGEQIATGKTRVDSPGYPVDLSISPDGMLLMVTYLYVDGGITKSYVAFYNFGNTGQNQMDNMVSDYTYSGIVVPQVKYLKDALSVAFRDDGFAIYKGKQIPKEDVTVAVTQEIISTFCNDKYIGMIFRSNEQNKQYTMVVYNTRGKQVFEESFNIEYSTVKISKDSILLYNDTQLCVFSTKGILKFDASLGEGTILNIFKTDMNRYQLVTNSGVKTIKLK